MRHRRAADTGGSRTRALDTLPSRRMTTDEARSSSRRPPARTGFPVPSRANSRATRVSPRYRGHSGTRKPSPRSPRPRREAVVGLAKGTLQHQHVGRYGLRRRARETGPRPQIAGIEDAAEVGLDQRLRRPDNVASRIEGHDAAVEGDRLAVRDSLDGPG